MNDREMMIERHEEQRLESQAIDHVQHYTALGVGMAAFAISMLRALADEVSYEDALDMVKAALGKQ